MPKKIKLYDKGDCVEVATWTEDEGDNRFFMSNRAIGLVLEAEYVIMDEDIEDQHEWLYRVILPDGRVTEVWDYEIRPVNSLAKPYNNISHKAKQENKWQNKIQIVSK